MESVEVSARTVDDAIDIALEELGLKRSQVQIEVLTPGKPGIFGLGGEQARVRVTALEEGTARPMPSLEMEEVAEAEGEIEVRDLESPEVAAACECLENILELAGIEAEVTVRRPETPGDGMGRASAVLDVEGEDLGLLIGRRGYTLAALQYVVNLVANRKAESRVLVSVDVEHYHRRREESLRGLAFRMADRVRQTGRPVTLEPMPPAERRIVHLSLLDDAAVTTGSVGSGDQRKVVVQPRRSPSPPNDRPPLR